MKATLIILSLFFFITSCSVEDDKVFTINGRVVRELTGEGLANQKVSIETMVVRGTFPYTYVVDLERKEVLTNIDGTFSVQVKGGDNYIYSTYKAEDENYSASELQNFYFTEQAILKVHKFLKFKVYVNNTNPFDASDFIHVGFYTGNANSYVNGIENFGAANVYYPAQSDGTGALEETSWYGTNVNSIIYFSTVEIAENFKLYWQKRKNGIDTSGFTENLPSEIDVVNEYHFDY